MLTVVLFLDKCIICARIEPIKYTCTHIKAIDNILNVYWQSKNSYAQYYYPRPNVLNKNTIFLFTMPGVCSGVFTGGVLGLNTGGRQMIGK